LGGLGIPVNKHRKLLEYKFLKGFTVLAVKFSNFNEAFVCQPDAAFEFEDLQDIHVDPDGIEMFLDQPDSLNNLSADFVFFFHGNLMVLQR